MQTGLSIKELGAKIEDNQKAKLDLIADTPDIKMALAVGEKSTRPVLEVTGREERFEINPIAHRQIRGVAKIPAPYYDRMVKEQPMLLADNVNTWFNANPRRRMLRTLDGTARALPSDHYNRIEHEEIAEIALPVLAEIPDVQFVSTQLTDRRIYIQAVSPRLTADVKVGDEVQAGVIISNSEVGMGSVSVVAMVWRLWCLNGCATGDKFRAYHVGRKIEDNAELWSDETKKADDRAVLLKVRDMVRAAVDETKFRERVDRMRALTEGEVKGDPVKAVEVLAQKVGVSDEEKGGILRSLIEGKDLTAWGLLNAVTAQAHTVRSYDRAVEFEVAGGRLLEMPKNDWQQVLEAT